MYSVPIFSFCAEILPGCLLRRIHYDVYYRTFCLVGRRNNDCRTNSRHIVPIRICVAGTYRRRPAAAVCAFRPAHTMIDGSNTRSIRFAICCCCRCLWYYIIIIIIIVIIIVTLLCYRILFDTYQPYMPTVAWVTYTARLRQMVQGLLKPKDDFAPPRKKK